MYGVFALVTTIQKENERRGIGNRNQGKIIVIIVAISGIVKNINMKIIVFGILLISNTIISYLCWKT